MKKFENTSNTGELVGIHGWLKFLVLKLWIATVVQMFGSVSETTLLTRSFDIGLGATSGIAALLLMRKNAKGILTAKCFFAVTACYCAVSALASLVPPKSDPFIPLFGLCSSLFWINYLKFSKRVKNTYFRQSTFEQTEDGTAADGVLTEAT